jgi:aminopeptidase N
MGARWGTALAIAAGFAWEGLATAAAPFSFDAAPGRLPKNVVPLDYSISIVPDGAAKTVRGEESVTLQFKQATATVVFNSVNQTFSHVLLDGKPVKSIVSDGEQQLATVTLAKPAKVGRHRLTFSFRGKIETGPPGLYAQAFVAPGGSKGFLISTKFEPTYARRMFPCWDEPAFRSTFELSATVPAAWATVSNMPVAKRVVHGKMATTTFQRTPRMPSYLVEFTAGDLAEINVRVGDTKVAIWAARGQEKDGAIALANAQQILADYNAYFGYPYPLPKLDSIAIPGGFTGAMENWGAITYNDQILLLTASSTIGNRQTVFSVQAHEMAHQWNGDLVTMGWWDDLWLNESFASWRAAKETDLRNPSWNWWEVEDASKETAMRADARVTSHSIEQHVASELQVQSAFDPEITYAKGQAVLRMFEAYLGPDTFRDGIRLYMKAHAFSNASSADLWNALSQVGARSVEQIAGGWTEQPGFPVVSVAASCDANGKRTLTLSQKRFLLQGSDPRSSHWSVPMQIRSGEDAAPQTVLLTQDGQSVPAGRCGQTLSANAGAVGFYRTAYDDDTLQADIKNFASMPRGDRIALLDDQWALVEAGAQKLPSYLALAEAMGSDLNERAWDQIAEALGTIEYDERGTVGHDAFAAYARSILKPIANRLGWQEGPEETPGIRKLRKTVIGDLGAWGDPETIAEARKRFASFVLDRSTMGPDEQELVLSIVARNADAATFDQLHAIARDAKNETELRRYYTAMMRVADPQLAALAAGIALSPEIPPQAAALRLQLVGQLNDENPQMSWATFSQNSDPLIKPHQPYGPLIIAQYIPPLYWNSVPLDQLEAWVKAHVPEEMTPVVARGMETARFRFAEKAVLVQSADSYIGSRHQVRD